MTTNASLLLYPASIPAIAYAAMRWEWAFYGLLFLFLGGGSFVLLYATYNFLRRRRLL